MAYNLYKLVKFDTALSKSAFEINMALSTKEQQQYSRHLLLPEVGFQGQEKLKNAKVLVIGVGGLGCPVLQYLTAAGVGTIGIIDDDIVEKSNLQRQVLFSYEDIGKPKVGIAVQRLKQLNPFVSFVSFEERLSNDNAVDLFRQFDIIVDGTDNFPSRYLVNDAAIISNRPVVFGSIHKFEGQVSVFNYKSGPTYRCLYPKAPKPKEVLNCAEIGVIGVLPGIIGSLQANEVIKMICDIGTVLSGKLLTFDALTLNQTLFSFKKNEFITIIELDQDYSFFCGIARIREITLVEFKESSDRYNLLDVREDNERLSSNIGGIHIPMDEIEGRISEIPTDKPLIVYCKSGGRSQMAIDILEGEGVQIELINLKNGIGM